jgi:cytochrome c peroxidase
VAPYLCVCYFDEGVEVHLKKYFTKISFLILFTCSLFAVGETLSDLPWAPLPAKPPIPMDNPMTPAKIRLGKELFFDPRLSKDGTVSCNSCHNLMAGGGDNRDVSVGVGGKFGKRSSPTVWNAAFHSVQFWDGRAPTLEEQAKGPLVNPVEMAMNDHFMVMGRVKQVPGYVTEFEAVFGGQDSLTIENAAKAIAAFERTLLTHNSAFDKYLRGNKKAISAQAEKGMRTVISLGCITCHNGVNFNGPELAQGEGFYQKFPTFPDNDYVKKYGFLDDLGRAQATKNLEEDSHMWRVPTWRNIALTAPYFHNGSVATLEEAIRVMAKVQLDKTVTDEQVADIVAFMKTLSGEFPTITLPRLPDTEGRTFFPKAELEVAASKE